MRLQRYLLVVFFSIQILGAELTALGQTAMKILPIGNSITRGSMCLNGDIGSCVGNSDADAISYRYRLGNLLSSAGYSFDYVGHFSFGYGVMTDPDNAGFSGIRDNYLADVMETGYSTYTGQVTAGAYLNHYPADMILLHIGTNDILADDYYSVADVERILDAVDQYETSSGKPVLVFIARVISRRNQPCNTDNGVMQYNNRLVSMAQSRINSGDHLVIVDMECGAGLDYSADMADQVHPTQTGYDKMADQWFSAIEAFNNSPVVNQLPDQSVDRGDVFQQISLDSYVYDVEDPPQNISWSTNPSNPQHFDISISENRIATITPIDPDWSGSETIEFVATDGGKVLSGLKKSGSSETTLTVNWTPEIAGQEPIVISEGGFALITEGDLVILEPEKAPAAIEIILQDGDHYDVVGQTVTPEPNFSGDLTVPTQIRSGSQISDTFPLMINVTAVNYPPVIISSPVTVVKSGHEYLYTLMVQDNDPEDVLIFSADVIPSWLQINEVTGVVSGIPSRENTGTTNVSLKVSDGLSEDTQSYSLEVQYFNYPPEITTVPDDSAYISMNYIYGIQASDQEGDPLTYFARSLPDWLSFDISTRVLIGKPDYGDLGTNLVILGVTDQIDTSFQAFNLEVVSLTNVGPVRDVDPVKVYPNPANRDLHISLMTNSVSSRRFSFELYDMEGRKTLSINKLQQENIIRLQESGLKDGLYLYRISDCEDGTTLHTGKLILRLSGN